MLRLLTVLVVLGLLLSLPRVFASEIGIADTAGSSQGRLSTSAGADSPGDEPTAHAGEIAESQALPVVSPGDILTSTPYHSVDAVPTGPCTLVVTVEDQNGDFQFGDIDNRDYFVTVVLYDASYNLLDEREDVDGTGVVTWTGIAEGTYSAEAYYLGPSPFAGGELWKSEESAVSGPLTAATLRRNRPHASSSVFRDEATGQILHPCTTLTSGMTVRGECNWPQKLDHVLR